MPGKPGFRVGDATIVNPGVMGPDEPTLSLACEQIATTVKYKLSTPVGYYPLDEDGVSRDCATWASSLTNWSELDSSV